MIVLRTQGAPQRGYLRGRSPRRVREAEVEPVPSSRASVVRAAPFASRDAAAAWLDGLRDDKEGLAREATRAAGALNRFVRAHRAAAADAWARDVSIEHALVVRVGYGDGDQVADGRYAAAFELPRAAPPRRRADLAPAERLAAIVAGRERQLACEELVLRARSDVDAGHAREAALQARIALEAVLAELEARELEEVSGFRESIGRAANEALRGEPAPDLQAAVGEAVAAMEQALRRMRLRGIG